jgi:hypothetical protein
VPGRPGTSLILGLQAAGAIKFCFRPNAGIRADALEGDRSRASTGPCLISVNYWGRSEQFFDSIVFKSGDQ